MTGTQPNGATGRPVDASRFHNNADMESAISKAEKMFADNPAAYKQNNSISIQSTNGRPVGSGYMGNTTSNQNAGIVGQKRETSSMVVVVDRTTGKAFTAYPDLSRGVPASW